MHFDKISSDLSLVNEVFYMSGYENDNLRKRASTNTKPMKVQMKLFTTLYPNNRLPYKEHLLPVEVNKDGTTDNKMVTFYLNTHRFYKTEKESIEFYNKSVQKVMDSIDAFKDKTSKQMIIT